MARPLRMERPGAWYHVTARGNERRPIYRDRRDRIHFCELLGETVATFRWVLHAYVLMDNHFHLIVETSEANLGRAMQWLNVSYSVWFNRRHERSGHLFQGRYYAVVVDPVGWGLVLSRYVHLNPVRVGGLGLDKSARQSDRVGAGEVPRIEVVRARIDALRSYEWSSFRAYVGLADGPGWLTSARVLSLAGRASSERTARSAYRDYVENAVRQGLAERPWDKLTARMVLGGSEFLRSLRGSLYGNRREQPALHQLEARPDWPRVVKAVETVKGESWADFRDRYGDWGRDLALYLGRKVCGLKLGHLAECAGGLDYCSVSAAVTRFANRLARDPQLARLAARCQALLEEATM